MIYTFKEKQRKNQTTKKIFQFCYTKMRADSLLSYKVMFIFSLLVSRSH